MKHQESTRKEPVEPPVKKNSVSYIYVTYMCIYIYIYEVNIIYIL